MKVANSVDILVLPVDLVGQNDIPEMGTGLVQVVPAGRKVCYSYLAQVWLRQDTRSSGMEVVRQAVLRFLGKGHSAEVLVDLVLASSPVHPLMLLPGSMHSRWAV